MITLLACCGPVMASDIFQAVLSGNSSRVRSELSSAPESVAQTDKNGFTPLHVAARHGYDDIARLLISQKANVNARSTKGATALHMAASANHAGMIDLLAKEGALIDASTNDGFTALHYAVYKQAFDSVKTLVDHKADVNSLTKSGTTPLHFAVSAKDNGAMAEYLVSKGADPSIKSQANQKSAIELASAATRKRIQDALAARKTASAPPPHQGVTVNDPDVIVVTPPRNAAVIGMPSMDKNSVRKEVGDGVYEGGWKSGRMSGQGKLSFEDGEEYNGSWMNGLRHGEGQQIFADGSTYEGSYFRGLRNGYGKATFPNGDKYEGFWRGNMLDGEGVYTFSDGGSITGTWRKGKLRIGKGSYNWLDASGTWHYEGEWSEDRRNGEGLLKAPDGTKLEGIWSDNYHQNW
jgi:hypothetical protein